MYCYGVDFEESQQLQELFTDYLLKKREQRLQPYPKEQEQKISIQK